MTNEQVFEIGSKVLQRASTDPEFRALALADGTTAVEQVIDRPLPDGVKIRFVENNGATFTLGLPPLRSSDELSDRELETVAGGRGTYAPGSAGQGFFDMSTMGFFAPGQQQQPR